MPPWVRWWKVLVRGPCMQDMCIGQELDIANLEDHVQRQLGAGVFQYLGGVLLLFRQGRDESRVAEARQAADEVWIVLAVYASVRSGFLVKDGRLDPFFLAMRGLAFTVKVPDRLCEGLGHIWVLALQSVPDVVRGDNVGFSTFEGAVHAQQTDYVAVVCVEVLACVCPVDAHFVDLAAVLSYILDVTEYVASAVLRYKVSEIGAQTHVCDSRLVVAPFGGREAFEEDEALAVQQLVTQCNK